MNRSAARWSILPLMTAPAGVAAHTAADLATANYVGYLIGALAGTVSPPTGMTVAYRILEARPLGEQAALGYVAADFSYPDRPTVHLAVDVVAVRASKGWRFAHYQAGPVAG
ncbi:hypothetical protein ACN27E_22230 [Mycobacterium sp. WMMD1722]|uniref:hypothetical protein n=1 Tax=Mycobacterium sp. WMMD1722 TaxID=3404117 RepID=UPI003BF5B503